MESIDIDFRLQLNQNQNQKRQQILQKYFKALKQFRDYADKTYHLRPYLFDNYILFHYFQQQQQHFTYTRNIKQMNNAQSSGSAAESWAMFFKIELLNHILDRRRQIMYWLFYLLLLISCIFVYRYESTTSIAERKVQSILYPGMRMWRRLTLPLIQRFPRLTEFYDESCLMVNPFFQGNHLSCKSCAQVEGVLDISSDISHDDFTNNIDNNMESNNIKYGNDNNKINVFGKFDSLKNASFIITKHVPFTFKNNHTPIGLIDFYKIYKNNHEVFRRDAYRVQSTNPHINNLDQLFIEQINFTNKQAHNKDQDHDNHKYKQSHTLWRCNRMLPARLLRQLINRPSLLPNTLAMERFVAIDTPQALSYTLPDTECPNVYIQQLLGARFIILRPTSECRQRCRTLSIRLPSTFVLNYNWWYWKPISAPDSVSDTLSISLIGSYC